MRPDMSLQEAARLYDLSLPTLGRRIRNGEIEAYKSEGGNRGEWRVTTKALEAFGYKRRSGPAPTKPEDTHETRKLKQLQRELAAARREAEMQRRRAEQKDRELGEALMLVGRLRAALADETSRRVHAEINQSYDEARPGARTRPSFPPAPDTIYLDVPKDERAVVGNDGGDDR